MPFVSTVFLQSRKKTQDTNVTIAKQRWAWQRTLPGLFKRRLVQPVPEPPSESR